MVDTDSNISKQSHDLSELETEMILRGMSGSTKLAYCKFNSEFLSFVGKDASQVDRSDMKKFLATKIGAGVAPRSVNLIRSALLFHYNEVLNKGIANIKVPKIARSLPIYLTKPEMASLINSAGSRKSRLIIKLLYSAGLRVSELCKLRIEEIDFKSGKGYVRLGKGGKDRLFFMGKALAYELAEYVDHQQSGWLFSNSKGDTLTERNIQKLVKGAASRAGIQKQVTPHKLRHSFATHLHDGGTSIRVIQELLGHSNLATTEIYTHVSSKKLDEVVNPLDELEEKNNN
ncbi:tyrosine-type recombinase/integrase [archaeon]|jgi:integrase/recombinase XerD|nr:tyrosine-type recombinase/integrase [archaeon]MBT6762627.1 tyrosine-type recombinase/integrase [archaeon]